MAWIIQVACLCCWEIHRTKRHERCSSYCKDSNHWDICPRCQKRMSQEFDRQLTPYVYIQVEEGDGA